MKNNVKKPFKKWLIPIFVVGAIGVGYLSLLGTNKIFSNSLIDYIDTFDKVEYENQLVPYIDDNGYYSLKTNKEIKILNITDIHLGGGEASRDVDKKTLTEVITIIQKEKPDLVILDGDNIFACPGPIFNGGGTFNNKMVSKVIMHIFEHLGVYYTTVFGNHDTEVFDYTKRQPLYDEYCKDKYKYCIAQQDFTDLEAKIPSVTNQIIQLKNEDNSIRKLICLIDSNAYINNSLSAVLNWDYDVVHDSQVEWIKSEIVKLSVGGETLKSLFFLHIPIGEFQEAYLDLEKNNFNDTETTKFISGGWDELVNDEVHSRIWYGGISNQDIQPKDQDKLFESLGPDGINSMQAVFVGHDHVNNAVVEYKGVTLSYGYSIDNLAYTDLRYSGTQRGATVITVANDGSWEQIHKNAYLDYGCSTTEFGEIYLDHHYYEGGVFKE